MKKFPIYRQLEQMDCGPTCLKMIARFYGKSHSLQSLREKTYINKQGVSLKAVSDAAETIGFKPLGVKITFEQLQQQVTLPCIIHWNQNHFVVVPPQKIKKKGNRSKILIADPAHGLVTLSQEMFRKCWLASNTNGLALLLEPREEFDEFEQTYENTVGFGFLAKYIKPYQNFFWQIFLGMFLSSLFTLAAPFLTQSLIDYGVNQNNLSFIKLILFSQILLFIGSTTIEIIRSWLLLHISSRINISIISDFLFKLMKLPMKFFDRRMVGDITQRVYDHSRIEHFLTGTSFNTIFSLVNLIIFSIVLAFYSVPIFLIFLFGSICSIFWILFFLKRRALLDYSKFQKLSENQNNLFEIITGMQDIKINNGESVHRWAWQNMQAQLFKLNIKSLSIEQYQAVGSSFFNQLKNIVISVYSATQVLNGHITLGMMLGISYIIGQMNSPIEHLISFFKSAQDAKLSIERLSEIHALKDEDSEVETFVDSFDSEIVISQVNQGIHFKDVSYQYDGPNTPTVLKDVNLFIPFGKVTAIVGPSGSGKTTLLKLLLKYYQPTKGKITVDNTPLELISSKFWRQQCGVVMSDSFIFSGTIRKNIVITDEVDNQKLLNAIKYANIDEYIKKLPLGLSTKIGNMGSGLSSGQRQRILIARAIYKNPSFIFLDEATNALDANNEKQILLNLDDFFLNRTVIVIAHRLSTVKNADQIIVMDNGQIVETGSHSQLSMNKGKYFELIKNQFEMQD